MQGFFQRSITIVTALAFLSACGAEEIDQRSSTKTGTYEDLFTGKNGSPQFPAAGYPSDPNTLTPKEDQIKDVFGETQGEAILDAILSIGTDTPDTLSKKQLDQLGQAIAYLMAANDVKVTQSVQQLANWMAKEMQKLKDAQNKGLIRSFFKKVCGFLTQIVHLGMAKKKGGTPLSPIGK